jgi:phage shock protein E
MKAMPYFIVALSLYFGASNVFAETQEVWIDVRSDFEHKLYSVEGDVRIDHDNIGAEIKSAVPDVDTPIHLYCWMGFNAEKAKVVLENLGYTHVKAGGINEARQSRD